MKDLLTFTISIFIVLLYQISPARFIHSAPSIPSVLYVLSVPYVHLMRYVHCDLTKGWLEVLIFRQTTFSSLLGAILGINLSVYETYKLEKKYAIH